MLIPERWRPWLTNAEDDLEASCDAGWHDLIVETIDAMVEAVKPDGRFAVRQIKEKFGGLRIYTFDARLSAIAHAAEERSYIICETCGEPGELGDDDGWYRTACARHRSPRWTSRPDAPSM